MKRKYLFIVALAAFLFSGFSLKAQYTWTQQGPTGLQRVSPAIFAIGKKAFIGGSKTSNGTFKNDLWCYNPSQDTWTAKTGIPGKGRYAPAGFSIGSKGYAGLGYDGTTFYKDLWEYDTLSNQWSRKADFPGVARYDAVRFVINGKAYVGMGSAGGPPYLQDLYCYNPALDIWTKVADFPSMGRSLPQYFVINGKAYLGMGWDGNTIREDWWEYNPGTDTWAQKQNFPSEARHAGFSYSLDSLGYVLGGKSLTKLSLGEHWKYSPKTDSWSQLTNFPGTMRDMAIGFVIGNDIYYGLGYNENTNTYLTDLWKYSFLPTFIAAAKPELAGMILYPSVNTGSFTVKAPFDQPFLIRIFDNSGHIVYENASASETIHTGLKPGSYIFQICGDKSFKSVKTGRFIVVD